MDLHGEIMNIQVEKHKQNFAIDEATKTHKNLKDIFVAVYTYGHRDARHAAAELSLNICPKGGLHEWTGDDSGEWCEKCFMMR